MYYAGVTASLRALNRDRENGRGISQCEPGRVASDAGGVTPWGVWFVPVWSARGAGEAVPCETPRRALTVS